MKILVDTNIILDHLLERKPFDRHAEWIFTQTEHGRFEAFVGGTTVTTVHYLVTKALGKKAGNVCIEKILRLFEVAPVSRTILASALLLKFADYEDAVLHEAAVHAGAEAIITRDPKGFHLSKIPIYSSEEFMLSLLSTVQ